MSFPVWPATLPTRVLVDGYAERPADVVLRSKTDTGPGKARRRSTAARRPIKCTIAVDGVQLDDLEAFFDDTLKGGSIPFDWVHPRTGLAATFSFSSPPEIAPEPGGATWLVAMQLELHP